MSHKTIPFRHLALGACVATIALSAQASQAATVMAVSNFDNAYNGSSVVFGGNFAGKEYKAVSFTTGNLDTQFESLSYFSQNIGPSQTSVDIYDASGSTPGSLYFTLSSPSGSTGDQETLTGSGLLSANTTYFAVFTATNSGDAATTTDPAQTDGPDTSISGSGWSIGDKMFTADKTDLTSWTQSTTTSAPRLQINVSVVPEPSSLALLGLGGLALILRRKK